MEGLKVSDADLLVYVHPSKSTKVPQAVLRELSSLLFKFNETFDGVVLAYDVQIRDKVAKILPALHPYFGVRLKAKLLTFSPKQNMLLEGKVVKLTQTSINVIVLGFSSAVITEEDIREEFEYAHKHGEDLYASRSHKRHVIKFYEEILHISGSLVPVNTGSIRWLAKHIKDVPLVDRVQKRGRESEGESAIEEHDRDLYFLHNDQIKGSKKRKIKEES